MSHCIVPVKIPFLLLGISDTNPFLSCIPVTGLFRDYLPNTALCHLRTKARLAKSAMLAKTDTPMTDKGCLSERHSRELKVLFAKINKRSVAEPATKGLAQREQV